MAVGYVSGWRAFRSKNMRNCLWCSKLALRGPETASKLTPEAPERCILRRIPADAETADETSR
eukprot:9412614-Alexandrium_andersonii.AAC.1